MDFIEEREGKAFNIRQRCFNFSKDIIVFVSNSNIDNIHFSIYDHLLKSATTIGANILDGKAGCSKMDWLRYLTFALKSANETKYWLNLIRDTQLSDEIEKINEHLNEATEISNIIASIIIKANKQD